MHITTGKRIIELVRRHGPISRAEMARQLELSKPTVSVMVDSLVRRDLLRELGVTRLPAGRSPRMLGFNPRVAVVVGVDLGPPNLRLTLADLDGVVIARRTMPTPDGPDLGARLASQIGSIHDAHTPELPLAAVAIGTPGVVDGDVIRYSPHLSAVESPDFLPTLRETLTCPLEVHNDVNLAAVAEAEAGSSDLIACLSIGFGLGVGLVWGTKVWAGTDGRAGELGYLPFASPVGSTLEDTLSCEGLARLHEHLGGCGDVEAALGAQDTAARRSREVLADGLAFAVVVLSLTCDPARIVLGGDLGSRLGLLLEAVAARARRQAPFIAPLSASKLGDLAVQRGALVLATCLAEKELNP